jgi:hypothetical protein
MCSLLQGMLRYVSVYRCEGVRDIRIVLQGMLGYVSVPLCKGVKDMYTVLQGEGRHGEQ